MLEKYFQEILFILLVVLFSFSGLFIKLWEFDLNLNLRENYYIFVFMFIIGSLVFGLIWQKKICFFLRIY